MNGCDATLSRPVVLSASGVHTGYGVLEILHGLSIAVHEGEAVALLGPNGAGKSTLLRAIAGLIPVAMGKIELDGSSLLGLEAHEVRRRGVAVVTEGLNLFLNMTVQDNLAVGASVLPKKMKAEHISSVYELFPALAARRKFLANQLSGGERKMLALGRALAGTPRIMLIDEPSLGLSPKMTDLVFRSLAGLKEAGVSMMVVEQDSARALTLADRAYAVEQGVVILEGSSEQISGEAVLRDALLGRVGNRQASSDQDNEAPRETISAALPKEIHGDRG